MTADLSSSLSLAGPELVVAVGALVLLMLGVYLGEGANRAAAWLAALVLVVAGAWVIYSGSDGGAFGNAFVNDPFARFMKVLTLIGSVVTLIMSREFAKQEKFDKFEYPVLVLLATLGMMLMIAANSMIALYLGLELQSLALYVVAAINRDSLRSTEAGLKYFVLGALSSGMLLYGITLVYGYTGSTGFQEIAARADAAPSASSAWSSAWSSCWPASPSRSRRCRSTCGRPTSTKARRRRSPPSSPPRPKMAAMALLVRVTVGAFEPIALDWQQIVAFISIASMVLGAFAAIGQSNIKRLMAYSSIGHMGFALVGLAANSEAGVRGVAIYMLIYMVMTLGTFAVILAMRRNNANVEEIGELSGPVGHQSGDGDHPDHPDVLAGRHSAARRLLGEMVRVPRGDRRQALCAGRHRRAGLGGGRLLLSAHHQDHVVRRAGRRLPADVGRAAHGARPVRRVRAVLRA